MNALAPVVRDGRIQLVGDGTVTGLASLAFIVRSPNDRARAMGERSFDAADSRRRWRSLRLREICETHPEILRDRLRDYRLVVVHSQEIDDAGEANVVLASFETWISQVRSAYMNLKAAGFTSFVLTPDHGFLLQDSHMREQPYGTVRDPKRRYVLSSERRAETGLVTASLTQLGYEGRDGREGWFLFREDTAVFATGTLGATFVHGGNSLQERVIPLLQVSVQRQGAGLKETYRVEAEALAEVLGHARIRVRALSTEPLLGNMVPPALEVALRVPETPEIRVRVKEIHGGGRLVTQVLRLEVDGEWAEVLFALEGPREERTYVEVHHPAALHNVDPLLVKTYFSVQRTSVGPGAAVTPSADPVAETRTGLDWRDNFGDATVLDVFTHLHEHGSLTEAELVGKLGSPRKARHFALAFDQYLAQVPFTVRVENNASGKRYVRGS